MIFRYLLVCILSWALSSFAFAQKDNIPDIIHAEFTADKQTPLIGEPITITLRVEIPSGVTVVEYPQLTEDWQPFMLVEITAPKIEQKADGSVSYEQILDARLWETGNFQTPETFVRYYVAGENDVYSIPVKPILFSVPSVLETEELNQLELKPLKPQIGILFVPTWVTAAVVTVLVSSGWYMMRWLERRRLEHKLRLAIAQSPTPYRLAVRSLIRLRDASCDPQNKLDGILQSLRLYLAQQDGKLGPQLTTSELILHARSLFSSEQVDELHQILEQGDLLKFANSTPNERTVSRLLVRAYRWLSVVEGSLESNFE